MDEHKIPEKKLLEMKMGGRRQRDRPHIWRIEKLRDMQRGEDETGGG
jgi:hypothetical protein